MVGNFLSNPFGPGYTPDERNQQWVGLLASLGSGLSSGQNAGQVLGGATHGLLAARGNIAAQREAAQNQAILMEKHRQETEAREMDLQSGRRRMDAAGAINPNFDPATAQFGDIYRQATAMAGNDAGTFNTIMDRLVASSPIAQQQLQAAQTMGTNLQELVDGTVTPMAGALQAEAARLGTAEAAKLAAAEPFDIRSEDREAAREAQRAARDQQYKLQIEDFKNTLAQPGKEREALLKGIETINRLDTSRPFISSRLAADAIVDGMQIVGEDGYIAGTGAQAVTANFAQLIQPLQRARDDGTLPDDGLVDRFTNLIRDISTKGGTISPVILDEMWTLSDKLYENMRTAHMRQAKPVLDAFSNEFSPEQLMNVPIDNPFRIVAPDGSVIENGDIVTTRENGQEVRNQFVRGRWVRLDNGS